MEAPTPEQWADAVAVRLASEWSPSNNDPETEKLLHRVLVEALKDRWDLTEQLVGSAIIEDAYFEALA